MNAQNDSKRLKQRVRGLILLTLLLLLLGALQWPRETKNLQVTPEVQIRTAIPLQRVTAYNPVVWQTDDDPEYSACGPTLPAQIAVSRDLLHTKIPCGSTVTILLSDGTLITGIVNDTMNRRYTRTADVMMHDYAQAVNFGVKTGTIILQEEM